MCIRDSATIVSIGDLQAPSSLISILGIILIAVFTGRNVKGGIFLAVIIAAVVGFFCGITKLPSTIFSMPPSLALIWFHYDMSELLSVDMVFEMCIRDRVYSLNTLLQMMMMLLV